MTRRTPYIALLAAFMVTAAIVIPRNPNPDPGNHAQVPATASPRIDELDFLPVGPQLTTQQASQARTYNQALLVVKQHVYPPPVIPGEASLSTDEWYEDPSS
ncbi:MAG TPA: hypothetical protein VLA04_01345 [Verrucomicrobiae bacterium]|nr:hypothetical protein [Verrucomicrobiae bacterium]